MISGPLWGMRYNRDDDQVTRQQIQPGHRPADTPEIAGGRTPQLGCFEQRAPALCQRNPAAAADVHG
jgi:hypothetical protein